MARTEFVPPVVSVTRAARLCKFLTATLGAGRTRPALLKKLKLDVRSFYRDLELLRALGVDIAHDGDKYKLVGLLDDAFAKLPFPDPGLSLQDAMALAVGRTEAHRKLRAKVQRFLGTTP